MNQVNAAETSACMNDTQEFPNHCPPLEILAAYLEGKLTAQEKSSIEGHFLDCGKCRKLVSLTLKSETLIFHRMNSSEH